MRTTIDLDDHLLRRLRNEALRRGVPFKTLLASLLRRALDDRTPQAPARYRCPTFAMGSPAAPLNTDKALALAAALEDEEIVREVAARK